MFRFTIFLLAATSSADNCMETVWTLIRNCRTSVLITGPHSTVGNVSGYICMSDCRARDRELDHGPVPDFREIDHEIFSTVILLPSA